jgi:cysteine desulfurase / selenocysteine lyase
MIYLDNASTTFPKPESVYTAMDTCARTQMANPGRGGYRLSVESQRIVDAARRGLMQLVGAPSPERCILVYSATDALNLAIFGIFEPGCHVITSELEHNSVRRPLQALAQSGQIELSVVPARATGAVDPSEVEAVLRAHPRGTRLIALTHASNVTGVIQPAKQIGALAQKYGALFLLDAAQTAGILPINMQDLGADMIAMPGHKGLYGPPGTGALCFSERVQLRPFRLGGTGGHSESLTQPSELPHALEAGTPNVMGLAGLVAGLAFVASTGVDAIRTHESALMSKLKTRLESIDTCTLHTSWETHTHVPTLSFTLAAEPHEIAAILDSHFSIAVRAGLHCAPETHRGLGTFPSGSVRASASRFNTETDIDRLADALREIAADLV